MSLQTEDFQKYIDLNKEKKELKKALGIIDKRLSAMQGALTSNLLENDMSKITIGDRTVYISEQLWASVTNKANAIKILQETGYEDYVTPNYNIQQLSRLLRDFRDQEELIPSEFEGIIEPVVKTNLNVIKA